MSNSKSIRNLHVFHDSRKRHERKEESCQSSLCWIDEKLHKDDPIHLIPFPCLIRIILVLQDSRKILRGKVESWQGLMKILQKLHKDALIHLTPTSGQSGTYMSSKTPGRYLEERWSLDRVSDVGSWWKFYRSFVRMLPFTWPQLQVNQESFCPSKLQEEPFSLDKVPYVGSWW